MSRIKLNPLLDLLRSALLSSAGDGCHLIRSNLGHKHITAGLNSNIVKNLMYGLLDADPPPLAAYIIVFIFKFYRWQIQPLID